ncbi:transglycosylase domain-containing protein [Flavilitoribacter nigricans]|uniref:Penicillin-binding protein n=1 Tax=Flavilitoribacter nigricans (strain ATCC 23147 / DSM 23189 / NBRC 102662 / NCIMB 1420 / SS-2) TaxID=1122177 RepID=A0A2D0MXP9_FLAN2|nr:transglycosylase domain-containing protein [Flavilitoribacter nigricans]PHN00679.1 penicillin-binding protein [Flavilitoribacter nigricans DSM 23189 = NBRC 102662]
MNNFIPTARLQAAKVYALLYRVKTWPDDWRDFRKKRPWAAFGVRALILLAVAALLAVFIFLQSVRMGAFGPLPAKEDLHHISSYLASEVYSRDGSILGRYYLENRSYLPYEQLPSILIKALIATEDARYFQHNGIDWQAWCRVLFKTLFLNDASQGGGSTISQQLAKNLYPRQDYGRYSLIINKIKEVFIARRLEALYTKEEILEIYLNTVSFSENTFGIKVAAHRFFNTLPEYLRPEQAAVLIGMLKATASYNPKNHPGRSLERRNLVLQRMAQDGYLPAKMVDSLQQLPLQLQYQPLTVNEGPATHFRETLRQELKELLQKLRKENGLGYNLYTDGLKIFTTIDSRLQTYAEVAVARHMTKLQRDFTEHLGDETPWESDSLFREVVYQSEVYRRLAERCLPETTIDSILSVPHPTWIYRAPGVDEKVELSPLDSIRHYLSFLNAGFLAADPGTGAVRAWVGGIDHQYFKYDHVRSRRSVGSTFKPIVYAKAIQKGIHPCAYTPNVLATYWRYEGWKPRNADNKYGGVYSMEGGLIHSVNTIAVQTALRARPKAIAELAAQLGLKGHIPGVPAIALGVADASLEEMVTAYGTFANRGKRPELNYIRRIETPEGKVLVDFESQVDSSRWEHVLEEQEADIINEMLRKSPVKGTAMRLRYRYQLNNDLAGKTGTSQNHSDGWFMGYSPRLVTGVWVGAEYPIVRFRNLRLGQGANTALPIFAEFMLQVNQDCDFQELSEATFPEPSLEVQSMLNCPNVIWQERDTLEQLPTAVASIQVSPMPAATSDNE